MSQELQYDHQITSQNEMIKTSDVRDNSITDITIIDFDTAMLCRDAQPCVSLNMPHVSLMPEMLDSVSNSRIKRLTLIHRQNNIQTTKSDSTVIQSKDSLKSHEIVQNKSSPDKASQAIFSTTAIIIILLILLAIIFIIKLVF